MQLRRNIGRQFEPPCFMNPKYFIPTIALAFAAGILNAQQQISLWPNGVPGFENRRNEPELAKDYWIRNINNPSLTVFLPPKEKVNGTAVIIIPGGGHRELVFNEEGHQTGAFFEQSRRDGICAEILARAGN
jgi:hypothetical protein